MKLRFHFALPLMTFAMLALSPLAVSAQTAKWGDVNGDGVVGAADAQAILTAVVGLSLPTGYTKANGDANCNGTLEAVDAQIVLSYVVGLNVSQFCVGTLVVKSLTLKTYATGIPTIPVAVLGNGDKISVSYWSASGSIGSALVQSAYVDDRRGIDVRTFYDASGLPSKIYDAKTRESIIIVPRQDRIDYLFYDKNATYVKGVALVSKQSKLYMANILTNPPFSGQISASSDGVSFSVIASSESGLGPLVEAPASFTTFFIQTVGQLVAPTVIAPAATSLAVLITENQKWALIVGGALLMVSPLLAPALGISLALPAYATLVTSGIGSILIGAVFGGVNVNPATVDDQFARSMRGAYEDGAALDQSPQQTTQSVLSTLESTGTVPGQNLGKLVTQVGDAAKDAFSSFIQSSTLPATNGGPTAGSSTVDGVGIDKDNTVYQLTGTVTGQGQVSASGTTNGKTLSISGTVTGSTFSGSYSGSPGTGSLTGSTSALGSCQTQQVSGGQGTFSNTYNMGATAGNVTFSYDAFSIPDAFSVTTAGVTVFSTGLVSGGATTTFALRGKSTVSVAVSAPNTGTAWQFSLGCPQ